MKNSIQFTKMHGSGNDFILIDNRDRLIKHADAPYKARKWCRRRFGVGADGFILIEKSQKADFKWYFFNADGSEAEMCGNGGRCAARFAFMKGICGEKLSFETIAGIIRAEVKDKLVKLEMTKPSDLRLDINFSTGLEELTIDYINTGVPHAVVLTEDLDHVPVFEWGRLIRYDDLFAPEGTNVDFVQIKDEHHILIRTYERGVEDETLACGTGAVASALIAGLKGLVKSPVKVTTWGNEELTIYFDLQGQEFREVFLEGGAIHVYTGVLDGDVG